MDKGILKETWDRLVTWKKVTFPSQDTLDELYKQGWSQYVATIPFPAYTSLSTPYPLQYPVTPEGEAALPGTDAHKRYLDTVRDIVAKQQDTKQDIKPSL